MNWLKAITKFRALAQCRARLAPAIPDKQNKTKYLCVKGRTGAAASHADIAHCGHAMVTMCRATKAKNKSHA